VVVFGDASGAARALIDRCPHRGVKLSLGTVRAGCVECPFHGWRFDGTGAVKGVPFNPDAKLEVLKARAVPCEERNGVIYLYTAVTHDGVAPVALTLPESLTRTDLAHAVIEVTWKTHWTRAMENMLDWPHLPFVHRNTIGRNLARKLAADPAMEVDVDIEASEFGASSHMRIGGERQPGGLDWVKPNMMVLHIDPPGTTFKMHVACVPVDAETTRMVVINTRSFLRPRVFTPLFVRSNRRIVNEDRAVVESSSPAEVPTGAAERSVRTDKLPLMFRKHYHDVLKASSA